MYSGKFWGKWETLAVANTLGQLFLIETQTTNTNREVKRVHRSADEPYQKVSWWNTARSSWAFPFANIFVMGDGNNGSVDEKRTEPRLWHLEGNKSTTFHRNFFESNVRLFLSLTNYHGQMFSTWSLHSFSFGWNVPMVLNQISFYLHIHVSTSWTLITTLFVPIPILPERYLQLRPKAKILVVMIFAQF